MKTVVSLRFLRETRRVQSAYKKGLEKALDRAGTITRRDAQKQLRQRKPKGSPTLTPEGDLAGVPLVSASFRPPTPGRVTTWRTPRNQGGYLRSAIRYAKDLRRESVVIGPSAKAIHVNTLQEFGGTATMTLRLVSAGPVEEFAGKPVGGRSRRPGRRPVAYVGQWVDGRSNRRGRVVRRAAARVPAGRYMSKGLGRATPKLPQQFRNLIQGP